MIDHIDEVDLLDLAADLGCISAEEQSFTFRPNSPTSNDHGGRNSCGKDLQQRSDHKQRSNGLTFSDHECDVASNYDGNIVCQKLKKKGNFADCGCSSSYHMWRKSSAGGAYEL